MEMAKSNWIWSPEFTSEDKDIPRFVMFRKKFLLSEKVKKAEIRISADTKYKLYVNSQFREIGPSRGDNQIWYEDIVDISGELIEGDNSICIYVLRYPLDHSKGNFGMFRTMYPGMYLVGDIQLESGKQVTVSADETWKCRVDRNRNIHSENPFFAPLKIYEDYNAKGDSGRWFFTEFDDRDWSNAKAYTAYDVSRAVSPGNLNPRTIPFMYRKYQKFAETLKATDGDLEQWNQMLQSEQTKWIPANSKVEVDVSSDVLMTGYYTLGVIGGAGSSIRLIQAESYVEELGKDFMSLPKKGNRKDFQNGLLTGSSDTFYVAGNGSDEQPELYSPFWFRTFRFIRLEIITADKSLGIRKFDYEETGYPLQIKTEIETSDPSLQNIWEISERTLQRCMHETYEDCPYWEQLQYAMDTRAQILFTYTIAADDRLARKCMDDFKRSQRYDGMINCCYPSFGPNVIPGFAIYYILMIKDHMMYFGDRELVNDHITTVQNILNYFHRNLTEKGYVGKVGNVEGEEPSWSFIDWTPEWNATRGVPDAIKRGPITMESLLYLMGLQTAEELARYINFNELADSYKKNAEDLMVAIKTYCIGKNGLIQDGPGVDVYSQHCQVFGVLTGVFEGNTGRDALLATVTNKKEYAQCSVAMSYYLFRALEKSDLYDYVDSYWDLWRDMIKKNLTTCVEDNVTERSDCHAWGAIALYELPSIVLGVKPASPGYQTVEINPQTNNLQYSKGKIITPRGYVYVEWVKDENGKIKLEYQLPKGMKRQ